MKKPHDQLDGFPKEEVRSAIRTGIMQAEEHMDMPRSGRSKGRRKIMYAFGSVAAAFAILVGSSYFSPALASSLSQIPIIGSVFGNSDLLILKEAQKNGLTTAIGETQTVDGISVTLDEILYDQNNITIGLYIESEEALDEHYFGAGMDFTIDGKSPMMASGSYGEDTLSTTTRTAIQEINVTKELPDAFELGLILNGENGETWYFSTPIEKISDIRTVPVNHSQTVDGLELTVTELKISQTGASLSMEVSDEETDFDLSRGGYIEFLMFDQNGNEIEGLSGGVTGELVKDKIMYTSNKHFDPIDEHVTELTITPHLEFPLSGGGVESANGKEKVLELKLDSLKPVEFESFKVEIP